MAWTEITRRKYRRDGLRYASDTTDEEWTVIAPKPDPNTAFFRAFENLVQGAGVVSVNGGQLFSQQTLTPTVALVGGGNGKTNFLTMNVNGALICYWSNGTNLWSKQIAP